MNSACFSRHLRKLDGLACRATQPALLSSYSSVAFESKLKDSSYGRWFNKTLAAAGALGAASAFSWLSKPVLHAEEMSAEYRPPVEFKSRFSALTRQKPLDEFGQMAWAVKNLEIEEAKRLLRRQPHLATLIDLEGNTLFHVAAQESDRYGAHPKEAETMLHMLLGCGWGVVDQKNRKGRRAEVVSQDLAPAGVITDLLSKRSLAFYEPLRAEKPLSLCGELSPVPDKWLYPVQDEQRRSYAGVVKRAVPAEKCSEWMDIVEEKGAWIQTPGQPRKVCWYVSQEFADCPYRYSGLEYPATVYPPFMQEIMAEICKICGIPPSDYPNSCNVNIYSDHTQAVGWHSDDEVMFQGLAGDTRILSFSLGVDREFCWRLQGTSTTLGSTQLGDGDVMTMEGLFQKHYKHSVPASTQPAGKRINFTFRWIKVKAHAADADVKAAR
jgi:alkylated DNA repair dioxygenase AlkB